MTPVLLPHVPPVVPVAMKTISDPAEISGSFARLSQAEISRGLIRSEVCSLIYPLLRGNSGVVHRTEMQKPFPGNGNITVSILENPL